jgi:hypothetical protein
MVIRIETASEIQIREYVEYYELEAKTLTVGYTDETEEIFVDVDVVKEI